MKNIKNLSKIYFLEVFSTFSKMFNKRNKNKKSSLLTFVGVGALVCYLFATIYFMYFSFAKSLQPYNKEQYVLLIAFYYFSIILLITTAFSIQGYFFKRKDFNLLGALPIKNYEIVASKLVSLILLSYFYEIFFFMPIIVVMLVLKTLNVVGTIYIILGSLFLPFFALLLSIIIGLIINFLSTKFKKSSWTNLLVTFVIFIVIFVAFYFLNAQINTIILTGDVPIYVYFVIPTNIPLFKAIQTNSVLWFLLFVLSNIVSLVLAIILLAVAYKNLKQQKVKKAKKVKENTTISYKQKPVLLSLISQEWKSYFNSSIYVFNTVFSMILLFIASIVVTVLYFTGSEIFTVFTKDVIEIALILIFVSTASLSVTTNVSISLEGSKLGLKKSLPISFKQVVISKYLLNILTMMPFITISYLTLLPVLISYKVNIISYFALLILPLLLLSVCSLFGLLINLKYPKLEFTNETEVVKQSLSVMISVFSNMALVGALVVLYALALVHVMTVYVYFLIIMAILVALNVLLYYLILNKGQKMYKNL